MDFMEKITELRAKKAQLLTEAESLVTDGKITEASAISDQMEAINTQIAGLEKLAKASREAAEPVYDGALHGGKPADSGKEEDKPFASVGEQLRAIYNFRKNHVEDKRLQKVNNAVLGSNEGSGADGGFALQTDFAGMIMERAPCSTGWIAIPAPAPPTPCGGSAPTRLTCPSRCSAGCRCTGPARGPLWPPASPSSGR